MPYEFDAYGIREEGIILASGGKKKERRWGRVIVSPLREERER